MEERKYGLMVSGGKINVFDFNFFKLKDELYGFFPRHKKSEPLSFHISSCGLFLYHCISLPQDLCSELHRASMLVDDRQLIYGDTLVLRYKSKTTKGRVYQGMTKKELVTAVTSFSIFSEQGYAVSKAFNVNEVMSQIEALKIE